MTGAIRTVALAGAMSLAAGASRAQEPPPGQVLSFAGLRALEEDPAVDDAAKVAAWEAFIARARRQLVYAEKAVEHWRSAGPLRLAAEARALDEDPAVDPERRCAVWRRVAEAFGDVAEGQRARAEAERRCAEVLRRRVERAQAVEDAGQLKVDRIRAWRAVVSWAPESPAGRAAAARIGALTDQLVKEAEAAEGIERLDDATKAELWRDVLRARPPPGLKARAQARVDALSAGAGG